MLDFTFIAISFGVNDILNILRRVLVPGSEGATSFEGTITTIEGIRDVDIFIIVG